MRLFHRPVTSWKVACWIAVALIFLPFFLPPDALPFGFNVFFAWTALCVATVMAQRMALWAALCITPLAMLSVDWLRGFGLHQDEFGFFPWGNIALFCGVALVTMATGALSILRTGLKQRANGS
jgi:hypothetical protein